MEPPLVYKLDLTELKGEGEFTCPGCGTMISPEDETDSAYKILETKVSGDKLTELVIKCNRCTSKICLTGFNTL